MKFLLGLLIAVVANAEPSNNYCEKLNWGPTRFATLHSNGRFELDKKSLNEFATKNLDSKDRRRLADPIVTEDSHSVSWTTNFDPEYMKRGWEGYLKPQPITDPLSEKVTGVYKDGKIVELIYESGPGNGGSHEVESTPIEYRNGICVPMGWDMTRTKNGVTTTTSTSISLCHDLLEFMKSHPQTQKPHCITTCDTDKYEQELTSIFKKHGKATGRIVPNQAKELSFDDFMRTPQSGPTTAFKLSAYEIGKCQGSPLISDILADERIWSAAGEAKSEKKSPSAQ